MALSVLGGSLLLVGVAIFYENTIIRGLLLKLAVDGAAVFVVLSQHKNIELRWFVSMIFILSLLLSLMILVSNWKHVSMNRDVRDDR